LFLLAYRAEFGPGMIPLAKLPRPVIGWRPSCVDASIATHRPEKMETLGRNFADRRLPPRPAARCSSPSPRALRCEGLSRLLRCDRSLAASP